jgi:hypothetical protein
MSIHRFAYPQSPLHLASGRSLLQRAAAGWPLRLACALVFAITACAGSAPIEPASDAPLPIDPAGTFVVTSTYSLQDVPAAAASALDELRGATDGPDDPSRYLIDLMIEKLPEGQVRTYAAAVAPYVAAYVNERIEMVAPHFADGARALSVGLARVAQRFGTRETFEISSDGLSSSADPAAESLRVLRRTIVGVRFDAPPGREVRDVSFEPFGLPDLQVATHAMVGGDRMTIDTHAVALPYRTLLRLGLDHAVIPSVVPDAHDLSEALRGLVDCSMLGALTAEWVGLGSPGFYATACDVGLTALAARLYARIDAIDAAALPLELSGEARAVDADGDGALDGIEAGAWSGNLAEIGLTGTFVGTSQ